MGRPAGWMTALTGRSPMKSPGACCRIGGRSSASSGVRSPRECWPRRPRSPWACSQAVGSRWFRHRGGMPIDLGSAVGPVSDVPRTRGDRDLKGAGTSGVCEIAYQLCRAPSTISRELRRNAATRGGKLDYRASVAQWKAELVAQRPKDREAGRERPAARVRAGAAVGPGPPRGRDAGRGPGCGAVEGPQQAASRGPAVGYGMEPGADRQPAERSTSPMMTPCGSATRRSTRRSMSKSRGALKRDLVACLRTGRALRAPRARSKREGLGTCHSRGDDQRAAGQGR